MTASPDLLHELRASRPVAPASLRTRTREVAATRVARRSLPPLRLPGRRFALVVVPAAAALALVSAGVVGLTHPGAQQAAVPAVTADSTAEHGGTPTTGGTGGSMSTPRAAPGEKTFAPSSGSGALAATPDRAQQTEVTLTVEVAGSDAVSRASQDALDLTRSLGGHVVNASVATGEGARASLTVRVPVGKVQQAVVGLSALGKIQSQQISIDDLQESLDSLTRRAASLRSQIVGITARLGDQTLDPEARARLEERRRTLRAELREIRRSIAATGAEARYATLQLTVVTPESLGIVPTPSRLHRTLDGALSALAWEGIVALAVVVVLAPFALVALAAWLGHRLYRRRETERLLAT